MPVVPVTRRQPKALLKSNTEIEPAAPTEHRHSVFHRSLTPSLLCNGERGCIDANVASCLLLRTARDVVIGRRIDDLVTTDSLPELEELWAAVAAQPAPALRARPFKLVLPDGRRIEALLSLRGLDRGRTLVCADVGFAAPPGVRSRTLTQREREVMTLVAKGYTGDGIASHLFLSPATVQSHVTNALVKLRAKNRAHGIAIAVCSGAIEMEEPL
jgi:DNA-binding CsgD family transcriptional regulator